jgi:peroxiredoxin
MSGAAIEMRKLKLTSRCQLGSRSRRSRIHPFLCYLVYLGGAIAFGFVLDGKQEHAIGKTADLPIAVTLSQNEHIPMAPTFILRDSAGKSHSRSSLSGRKAVLFFFCGCEPCQECAQRWARLQKTQQLSVRSGKHPPRTVLVFLGDREAMAEFRIATGLDQQRTLFLLDEDAEVARTYRALPCPRVFVLDEQGRIQYTNDGLDDQPARPRLINASGRTGHGAKRATEGDKQKASSSAPAWSSPIAAMLSRVIDALSGRTTAPPATSINRSAKSQKNAQ